MNVPGRWKNVAKQPRASEVVWSRCGTPCCQGPEDHLQLRRARTQRAVDSMSGGARSTSTRCHLSVLTIGVTREVNRCAAHEGREEEHCGFRAVCGPRGSPPSPTGPRFLGVRPTRSAHRSLASLLAGPSSSLKAIPQLDSHRRTSVECRERNSAQPSQHRRGSHCGTGRMRGTVAPETACPADRPGRSWSDPPHALPGCSEHVRRRPTAHSAIPRLRRMNPISYDFGSGRTQTRWYGVLRWRSKGPPRRREEIAQLTRPLLAHPDRALWRRASFTAGLG